MEAQSSYSLLRPRPSGLLPFVLGSVVAHALLTAVALTLSWVFAGPALELDQQPIKASLVRLGKKRDEKLLPRKEELPPPPPPKAAEVPSPTPAPPDKAVKIPSKDAKPEKPVDTKKSLFDALNKVAKPEELEGDPEGDVHGDSAVQEGERYFGLLKSVVQRNYDVSDSIPEAERRTLKAEVALNIGSGGELLSVKLTRPSGNELFDAAVLGAVKKTAPFAPPPKHLAPALKKDGVAIVFRAAN
jgi:TonB family protein